MFPRQKKKEHMSSVTTPDVTYNSNKLFSYFLPERIKFKFTASYYYITNVYIMHMFMYGKRNKNQYV